MDIPETSALLTYAGFIAVGAFLGVGTGMFASGPSGGQAAGEELVQALETQTGQDLELLNVESEEGLYRVDVRTSDDRIETYYTSPSGGLFFTEASAADTQRVVSLAREREELGNCLRDRDATLYGNASQRATVLQIQALGQNNLEGVYADVNNGSTLRTALQQGVRTTPAFVFNGSALTGVNTPQRIAEFTGCSFNVSQ